MRGSRTQLLVVASLLLAARAGAQAPAPPAPPPDGLHALPSLYWQSGAHRLDLGVAARVRTEAWDADASAQPDVDWLTATRLRLSLRYAFAERFSVFVEGQDVRIHGLDADLTAPASLYYATAGGDSSVHDTSLRQAWAEVRPTTGLALRAGRQDIKLGSEVSYAEPEWKYLKAARLGERLVGTVGWTHVERSNDGVTLSWDRGGHHLYAFAARPTTGVFAVETGYRPQHDLGFAGAAWTVKRGEWLPDDELGLFAIAYDDDRSPSHGGLAEGVEVYTFGASWLGVRALGAGRLDTLAWLAGQTGDYDDRDHSAWAGLFELGYQLPDVLAKPWLRVGANLASGDGDPLDGDHHTFFNLLPTNHLYYGFADQLAFQNLKDLFVQLRLAPHEKVSLNAFVHYFSLWDADDVRYAGSGAFDRASFGYSALPSAGGGRTVGVEYDLVATLALHRSVVVELGLSHLDAGSALPGDVDFGYLSVELRY